MKIFRLIFLLLHAFLVNGTSLVEDILKLKLDGDSVVSMDCKKVLKNVQKAFDEEEIWTIKLIDSSGRIASDFVSGNNYWLGSKEACSGVHERYSLRDMSLSNRYFRYNDANLTSVKAPFEFFYYVTYVEHHSPYQLEHKLFKDNILHLGTCLPKICSQGDVTELINEVLEENFDQYKIIGKNFTVLHTKMIDSSFRSLRTKFVFIALVVISSFCVLITTFCTLFRKKLKTLKYFPSIFGEIIDCFSLKQNLKNIFQHDEDRDPLKIVIHGVRALTTVYLVTAHIGYFSIYVMDNSREGLKHVNDIEFFPFINAPVVIENFFTLSGFLLGLGVINAGKISSTKMFFEGICFRFLRLMIPYIPALLIFMSLASYFEHSSPYMTFLNDSYNCEHYWWRNVLFVNNFFPFEEICYVTTWYISADFQLFITILMIFAIRNKFKRIGNLLLYALFVTGLSITAFVGYSNNFSFFIDVQLNQLNKTYFPVWTRISSYLMGVFGALAYQKLKQRKINKKFIRFFWVFNLILSTALYFGQTYRVENAIFGAFSLSLGRTLWSFCVIWLIVTTALTHGGIVGRIFSQKLLIPISRISYSMCLVNQLVLFGIWMSSRPHHYELPMNIVTFMGFGAVIIISSIIFNLIFEFPFVRAIKVLRKIE